MVYKRIGIPYSLTLLNSIVIYIHCCYGMMFTRKIQSDAHCVQTNTEFCGQAGTCHTTWRYHIHTMIRFLATCCLHARVVMALICIRYNGFSTMRTRIGISTQAKVSYLWKDPLYRIFKKNFCKSFKPETD